MSGWPRIGVEPCEKLAVHIKVLDLCCLIAVLRADTGLRLRRRDIKAERNGVLVHRYVLHGCVIEVAEGNVQMLVQQLFDLGVGKAPDDLTAAVHFKDGFYFLERDLLPVNGNSPDAAGRAWMRCQAAAAVWMRPWYSSFLFEKWRNSPPCLHSTVQTPELSIIVKFISSNKLIIVKYTKIKLPHLVGMRNLQPGGMLCQPFLQNLSRQRHQLRAGALSVIFRRSGFGGGGRALVFIKPKQNAADY